LVADFLGSNTSTTATPGAGQTTQLNSSAWNRFYDSTISATGSTTSPSWTPASSTSLTYIAASFQHA
jgi:hypothetical protein